MAEPSSPSKADAYLRSELGRVETIYTVDRVDRHTTGTTIEPISGSMIE